jgi:hypothetical protein
MKVFTKSNIFQKDLKTFWIKNLFLIYKKIYIIGLKRNSSWINILNEVYRFFDINERAIVKILLKFTNE